MKDTLLYRCKSCTAAVAEMFMIGPKRDKCPVCRGNLALESDKAEKEYPEFARRVVEAGGRVRCYLLEDKDCPDKVFIGKKWWKRD